MEDLKLSDEYSEEYTLPSKGLVYSEKINPNIKIRSMTTREEIKRLGHSTSEYKKLAEVIDDCLIVKPGIPTYDLVIGDYQFLLHKLRIVTYGSGYKTSPTCPYCGRVHEETLDLQSLPVTELSASDLTNLDITLPTTKHKLQLRMQTPRMLDEVKSKTNDFIKRHPDTVGDTAFLYTLMSVISKVDGEVLDDIRLESFVNKLPMNDSNYILQKLNKIQLGIDPKVSGHCPHCGKDFEYIFPITGEFFGPTVD